MFANQPGANALRPHGDAQTGPGKRTPQVLKSLETLVAQGNTALGGGNVVLAQLRAKQALQQYPDYLPALLLLRKCLSTTEAGSEEHENVLRWILRLDPNDVMAATELCTMLFNKGETEECEALARSCLRLMPLNPTLQSVMGLLLSQRGRPAAGEFHFRRVIELDGEKPVVANNLAFCLKLQGKVDESEEWYRNATQMAPDDASIWVGWSKLEEARRNIPRAWELLREAEQRAPDEADLALERAIQLGREGKTTEAVAELNKSRETGKRLPAHTLYERGRIYDKMDRFGEAWTDFSEANRLVREVQ